MQLHQMSWFIYFLSLCAVSIYMLAYISLLSINKNKKPKRIKIIESYLTEIVVGCGSGARQQRVNLIVRIRSTIFGINRAQWQSFWSQQLRGISPAIKNEKIRMINKRHLQTGHSVLSVLCCVYCFYFCCCCCCFFYQRWRAKDKQQQQHIFIYKQI